MSQTRRTPAYVAKVLCRFHLSVTARALLDWADKGLLPRLAERGKGQGKGKVYYWPQPDIIHRAYTVWELMRHYNRTEYGMFALWLLGYDVSVERWVKPQFMLLLADPTRAPEDFAYGGEYSDEAADEALLDRLSEQAVQYATRWRHIPRQQPHRNVVTDPRVVEIYLNVLSNPAYEPSIDVLAELIDEFSPQRAKLTDANAAPTTMTVTERAEYVAFLQQWLSFAARSLSHPRQYATVLSASESDWHQAQTDFQRILNAFIGVIEMQGNSIQLWGLIR